MNVEFTVLNTDPTIAPLLVPKRATPGSSGYDLTATHAFVLPSNGFIIVGTGISVAMPKGYELQVRSRSGLAAKHGLFVLNGIGTIDSDYRGEIKVILGNLGTDTYKGYAGERIAQAVFAKVEHPELTLVEKFSEETERGAGRFGSTGQ